MRSLAFLLWAASSACFALGHANSMSSFSGSARNTLVIAVTSDTTAPILSGATGTANGAVSGLGSVVTDEGNLTLYGLASVNATESSATIAATGTPQTITTAGTKNFTFSGLTDLTTYYAHYYQVDAAGNGSNVATSAPFTTGSSDITVTWVKSRVADGSTDVCAPPCYILGDATASTATSATHAFHDVEWTWDFGDTGAGTWTYGTGYNTSKNAAKGMIGPHVYETAGTYSMCLTGRNAIGTSAQSCKTIVVSDPDVVFASNTICIAAATTPVAGAGGCPSGAAVSQNSDYDAALTSALAASKKRILFKRGDTFTASATVSVTGIGGLIGAYGSGAKPILQGSAGYFFRPSSPSLTSADWRFMDFTIDGQSSVTNGVTWPERTSKQLTYLRIDASNIGNGFIFSGSNLDYYNNPEQGGTGPCTGAWPYTGSCNNPMFNQIAVIDCTIYNITGGGSKNGIFTSWIYSAAMGNNFNNNAGGEHTIRTQYTSRSVYAHNTLANPADTKHAFTLRGSNWVTAGSYGSIPVGVYSDYNIVSDNKITGRSGANELVKIGPQNNGTDERRKDILFERNWVISGGSSSFLLGLSSDLIDTVRNNVFDMGSAGTSITIGGSTNLTPVTDEVYIYNNTFYSSASGTATAISLLTGVTDVTARNNLVWAPNKSSVTVFSNGGASGNTTGNSTSNAQAVGTSPNFASGTPSTPADFIPANGSYADDAGTAVPVFSDFFSATTGSPPDIGAVVH